MLSLAFLLTRLGRNAGARRRLDGRGRLYATATSLLLSTLLPLSWQAHGLSPTLTRTYALKAGWNAIYLDVQPTNTAIQTVFTGIPIASVWRFQERLSAVEFIKNPAEPVWNTDRWLVHVPTNEVASLDNNLYHVTGGMAYLIRVAQPATWRVTGSPVFSPIGWKPNAYNLRGFPIDPGIPLSFRDYFKHSPAHFNKDTGQLEAIHRLNASGQWEPVAPSDLMEPRTAYWVYTRGQSSYVAPFEVRIDGVGALNYDRVLNEAPLRLVNHTTEPLNITIEELAKPNETALRYAVFSNDKGFTWPAIPPILTLAMAPNATKTHRLRVQRAAVPSAGYESYLDIRDNEGVQFLLPVRIQRYDGGATPAATASARSGRAAPASPKSEAKAHAGLWGGVISITHVSEAHSGNLVTNEATLSGEALQILRVGVSTNPTPVARPFDLRVLLHVDADGHTRLLQEVTQLWKDGSYTNDALGNRVVSVPGKSVLVTDETKLGNYAGATISDNTPIGRRLTAPAFYFPSTPDKNFLLLDGDFAVNQIVSGAYTIGFQDPRNPYLHRYHPDHDNLDARFKDIRKEAFDIGRSFQFEIQAWDPAKGTAPPDYDYATLNGVFRETLTGLHKYPIHLQGTLQLKRLVEVAELNP